MKFSHIISATISLASNVLLAGAILPESSPNEAWIRFYDRPNCQVGFHETGLKDFYRLTCGPKLDQNNCISGNFLSYRLERHPGPDDRLPKLDQLIIKTNSSTCDMTSEAPGDVRQFAPHPYSNPGFLDSGCHLFNPTNPLGINPRNEISYTYWCTWGSFTPGQQAASASPTSLPVQPQTPMINPVAPAMQQPPTPPAPQA